MYPTKNRLRSRNLTLQGKALGVALLASLTTACGSSGAPGCDDAEVMGLVDEISRELIADEMVPTFIMQVTRMSPQMWGNPDTTSRCSLSSSTTRWPRRKRSICSLPMAARPGRASTEH